MGLSDVKFGRRERVAAWNGFGDLKIFTAKLGKCSGPGLKAANAVEDSPRRTREIDKAIFFLEDWGQSGLRMILRTRMDCTRLQATQSFDHQAGTDCSQTGSESFGSVIGRDGQFALEEDVAGVEPDIEAHGGYAGDGFALRDRPLDRRGTPILREKRGVQVDVA